MLSTFMGRLITAIAILIVAYLQYKMWMGEGGYRDHQALVDLVRHQDTENLKAAERNRVLSAEVDDLKNGMESVEEHARMDLGLIRPHETFVQLSVLPPPAAIKLPAS
jgi:cell division protein FtsB